MLQDKSISEKCKGCYYASVVNNRCLKKKKKTDKDCGNIQSNVKAWCDK